MLCTFKWERRNLELAYSPHKETMMEVRQETMLEFYSVTSVLGLLYGSETWIMRETDKSRLQTNERKFPRSVTAYSRTVKRGPEDIIEKLNTFGMNIFLFVTYLTTLLVARR